MLAEGSMQAEAAAAPGTRCPPPGRLPTAAATGKAVPAVIEALTKGHSGH